MADNFFSKYVSSTNGGGGGGSGTVTSVGLSLPGIFSVTGSPVTVAGTLTASFVNQNANLVFAGPATGSPADPSFRSLVAADIPSLPYANTTLSNLTATVAINQDIFFQTTNTFFIGDSTNYPASVNAAGVNADMTAGMGVRDFAGGNSPVFTMANRTLPDGTATVASLASGNSTTVANQRIAAIMSRNFAGTTNTGLVTLQSGNATGATNSSGDILLRVGTVVGGTRGKIRLVDASLTGSSVGYVWTLANTSTGAGAWQAASAGANTSLSNLTSTSINQSLLPNAGNTFDLGSSSLTFANAYAGSVFTTAISPFNAGSALNITTVSDTSTTGAILIRSGNNTGANLSGNVTVQSGATIGDQSGDVIVASGNSSGSLSGNVSISTGTSGTNVASGAITMGTADVVGSGAVSGTVLIKTGASPSNNSGSLTFQTGAAGSTRGKIVFQDGTEGTAGYVWTSTDTSGSGSWAAAGSSGANTTLSNLTSPTAINQDLFFATTNTFFIGDTTNYPASVNAAGVNADLTAGMGVRDFAAGSAPVFTMASRNMPDGTAGVVTLASGNSTTVTNQRIAAIMSRNFGGTTNTGLVTLQSGNATGATNNSGDILLRVGTVVGGTRGKIRFVDASLAGSSTGYVWTLSNTSTGAGEWATLPASSGANTSLSNLSSTAVNTDILPDSNLTRSLGSSSLVFATVFVNDIQSGANALLVRSTPQSGINSGNVVVESGAVTGAGDSGDIFIRSGSAASNDSGDITIQTGTAGTTRGSVNIDGAGLSISAPTNMNSNAIFNLPDPAHNDFSRPVTVQFANQRMGYMRRYVVNYNAFTAASTNETIVLEALPAGALLKEHFFYTTTAFTGGAVSAATVNTNVSSIYDVFAAPGDTNYQYFNSPICLNLNNPINLELLLVTTGDNINQLTAGQVIVNVSYEIVTAIPTDFSFP